MKTAGFLVAIATFAYCGLVVWAVGQADAAGFNFRGEW